MRQQALLQRLSQPSASTTPSLPLRIHCVLLAQHSSRASVLWRGEVGTVFAFSCPDNISGFTGSFLRATESLQGPEGDELLLLTLPLTSFSPWFSSEPVGRLMAGL